MNAPYRPGLPPLPAYMRDLPLSEKGYPVPYFVSVVNGRYDFQLADSRKWLDCTRNNRCWICGKTLGAFKVFALGPMGAINRICSEPPSHLDCAEYAVEACPFLLYPNAKRRELNQNVPQKIPAGVLALHNPGVTLLWSTKSSTFATNQRPCLLLLGEPTTVRWYTEGHLASQAQASAAVDDARERLSAMCGSNGDLARLAKDTERLRKYLPRLEQP